MKRRPTATKSSAEQAGSPAQQVAGFIAKFDPRIQRLIRASRAKVRKRFPTGVELIYDNYNFFVIGYGSTERASDAICSIAAYAKGVGLCLIHGAKLPDPHRILKGSGKQTRFVSLPSAATLDEPAVVAVLREAVRTAKTPLPKSGRLRTVIKSVSKKQRPRRPAASARK